MIRKLCLGLLLLTAAAAAHAAINLSASAGNNQVSLTWSYTAPTTAATQEVYRDADSNPSGRVRIATVSTGTRNYSDTSALNGTTYWYWLKNTSSGTVTNSNAASATPTAPNPGGGSYTPVTTQ